MVHGPCPCPGHGHGHDHDHGHGHGHGKKSKKNRFENNLPEAHFVSIYRRIERSEKHNIFQQFKDNSFNLVGED